MNQEVVFVKIHKKHRIITDYPLCRGTVESSNWKLTDNLDDVNCKNCLNILKEEIFYKERGII